MSNEDGLTRSVGTRIAERDRWDPNLFSPKQDKLFLINFGQTINRFAADWRILGGGRAFGDRAANRAMHFPIAFPQLFNRPHVRKNELMFRTNAGAFAVNGLRARHDNFLNPQIFLANDLEHLGCA